MISRDELENKKKSIESSIKRLEANINASLGALQLIDELIASLDNNDHDATEKGQT